MAKYGTFKYGAKRYGADAAAITRSLTWGLVVDWTGTGYTGENEAHGRMTSLEVSRGRQHRIRPDGKGLEHYLPGEAVVSLDNEDGRYDPRNSLSPLYPNVAPGKFCRLSVKDESTGTVYSIMRGRLDSIQPVLRGGRPKARLVIRDGLFYLANITAIFGLIQNETWHVVIDSLINASSWPSTEWPKTGYVASTDTYTYWWAWQVNALEALNQLEDVEIGAVWHDRDGTLATRPRGHTYTRSLTVPQDVILRDLVSPQPWELIRNNVRIVARPKKLDPVNDELWGLQETPAIAAGESLAFEARYRWSDHYPVAGGGMNANSFAVNTAADGSGTDITASCTVSFTPVSGGGTTVTVTNNSGSNGYITLLRLVGDAIYNPHPTTKLAESADSQGAHGLRALTIDAEWEYSSSNAGLKGAWLLNNLEGATDAPIIQFHDRPSYQFYLDLYDRIRLLVPAKGIAHQFRVGGIRHESVGENCEAVLTTLTLEPYLRYGYQTSKTFFGCLMTTVNAWVWPSGGFFTMPMEQELFDTDSFHGTATPEFFQIATIPDGFQGYYYVFTFFGWETNATGARTVAILVNEGDGAGYVQRARVTEPAVTGQMTQFVAATLYLNAGDKVRVGAEQTSGGDLNTLHIDSPYIPIFGLFKIG